MSERPPQPRASPVQKRPQSDRRLFFKSLAADVKANREASKKVGGSNLLCSMQSSCDARPLHDAPSFESPATRPHQAVKYSEVSMLAANVKNASVLVSRGKDGVLHHPRGDCNSNPTAARIKAARRSLLRTHDALYEEFNFGHTTEDMAACAGEPSLADLDDWNEVTRTCADDNFVRAHIVDHHVSTSVAVSACVELRRNAQRHFVIKSGPQVLASFPCEAIKITRFWGVKSSIERFVAITPPDSDPEGVDAVYLKLDSWESLRRLSRMTGFDLE